MMLPCVIIARPAVKSVHADHYEAFNELGRKIISLYSYRNTVEYVTGQGLHAGPAQFEMWVGNHRQTRKPQMKKTLADLLDPETSHYRSVGELARTLQFLMSTAGKYRHKGGKWGNVGPSEPLSNYGGCVNHVECDYLWHSGRIVSTSDSHPDVTTWQQNHDCLYDCILAGLCAESPTCSRWRKEHSVHLHMLLKFPMAYQNNDEERKAWTKFMALHRHQLNVSTLNDCHNRVNLLAAPELIITPAGIKTKVGVTQKSEIRTSPRCYSRWCFGFLMRDTKWGASPKWNCQRETFADFILRAVQFYKSVPSDFIPAR